MIYSLDPANMPDIDPRFMCHRLSTYTEAQLIA